MITKQQKDLYIWDYNIKVKTKDGKYDFEEETKEKMKVKIYDRRKIKRN